MSKFDWALIVVLSFSSAAVFDFVNNKYLNPKPMYIVADVVKIVEEHKVEMRKQLDSAVDNKEMAAIYNDSLEYMNHTYKTIDEFGKKNNVIVFQKNAVVGTSIEDYTDEIKQLINK